MWNTDAYNFQESTDPIYKSIPFFLTMRAGRTLGVLMDNTWRTSFDFGKQTDGVYSFGAEAGPIDYYLALWSWVPSKSCKPMPGSPALRRCRRCGRWVISSRATVTERKPNCARSPANYDRSEFRRTDFIWTLIFRYNNRPFTVDPAKVS